MANDQPVDKNLDSLKMRNQNESPASLNSNRVITGKDLQIAQDNNPNKFDTVSKLLPIPPGLTREQVEALAPTPFCIDMGDGKTVKANTKGQKNDLTVKADVLPMEAHGYAEPPAEAANGQISHHWNPSRGDLNPLDPSSWSKLQMYAGDVGRANGWDSKHNHNETNALRHALSAAYITYNHSAAVAITAGDLHEIQTGMAEINEQIPWKTDSKSIQTWNDHDVDLNNNLAGAKIAQGVRNCGGSWREVEQAVTDAIKHQLDAKGRIAQPNVVLHNFLDQ